MVRWWRSYLGCFAVTLLGLVLAVAAGSGRNSPSRPAAIVVHAAPIPAFEPRQPDRRQFGGLEFRGGLVLTSSFKRFGGLSAIRVAKDGAHFLSISDRGWWLRGRIAYEGERPRGIVDAEMAPMLGPDGRPITARGWYDSESLAHNNDIYYVGLERVHRILRFNYGRYGLRAHGRPIHTPSGFRGLPSNKGIESLVFVPRGNVIGGSLIAIAERGLDAAGNNRGWLIGGRHPGTFTVKRKNDFDISDATLLPSGDLLILERKFSPITGLFIRIRRIALASVRPGALVDGQAVFESEFGEQLDNMEGISAHTGKHGTVLTLVSDDNFSMLQRTLLLQFRLIQP